MKMCNQIEEVVSIPVNASTIAHGLTTRQIEQLLKPLSQLTNLQCSSKYQLETYEEIDAAFADNMFCLSGMFDNSY